MPNTTPATLTPINPSVTGDGKYIYEHEGTNQYVNLIKENWDYTESRNGKYVTIKYTGDWNSIYRQYKDIYESTSPTDPRKAFDWEVKRQKGIGILTGTKPKHKSTNTSTVYPKTVGLWSELRIGVDSESIIYNTKIVPLSTPDAIRTRAYIVVNNWMQSLTFQKQQKLIQLQATDVPLTIEQYCQKYGYSIEVYDIATKIIDKLIVGTEYFSTPAPMIVVVDRRETDIDSIRSLPFTVGNIYTDDQMSMYSHGLSGWKWMCTGIDI